MLRRATSWGKAPGRKWRRATIGQSLLPIRRRRVEATTATTSSVSMRR
jgi:hypothetical protein